MTVEGSVSSSSDYPMYFSSHTWNADQLSDGVKISTAGGYVYTIPTAGRDIGFAPSTHTPNGGGFGHLGEPTRTSDNYTPDGWPHVECGLGYPNPCVTYSGGFTVKIKPYHSDLTGTLDSASYLPGSTVKLTTQAASPWLQGMPMGIDEDAVLWVPQTPDDTSATMYPCGGVLTCTHSRKVIGTTDWVISAFINGEYQTKTAHVKVAALKLTASPPVVLIDDSTTFTANWDDGHSLSVNDIVGWTWTPDSVAADSASHCQVHAALCNRRIHENGTMAVQLVHNGVSVSASAHVKVVPRVSYTTFSMTVDNASSYPGGSTTFRAQFDGSPGSVTRWKWRNADSSSSTEPDCEGGQSTCEHIVHKSGRMCAYLDQGGVPIDSACVDDTTLPRRHIHLSPSDTVYVLPDGSVFFVATAEGAQMVGLTWSGDDFFASGNRISSSTARLSRSIRPGSANRMLTGVESSTCTGGDTTCVDQVSGSYVRSVTATVDDSMQAASVVVLSAITGDDCMDIGYDPSSLDPLKPFDKNGFATYLRSHATGRKHQCAHYVREAMCKGGGGLACGGGPDAKDYGDFLTGLGFSVVATGSGLSLPPGYTQQIGDIAVFNYLRHGHVCGWDGLNWTSDYIQPSHQPDPNSVPDRPYTIYRHP